MAEFQRENRRCMEGNNEVKVVAVYVNQPHHRVVGVDVNQPHHGVFAVGEAGN